MMFRKSTFKITYVGEIFTRVLMLPYVGKELQMIIMLPDEHMDLKEVTGRPTGPCWRPGGGGNIKGRVTERETERGKEGFHLLAYSPNSYKSQEPGCPSESTIQVPGAPPLLSQAPYSRIRSRVAKT